MNHQAQVEEHRVAVSQQRTVVRRYLSNRTALEAVLADIAEGTKPSDIAKRLQVSYHALYTVLNGTYKDQYRAARAAYADLLAEKNLEMADRVEKLELPHDAAKTAAGLRQWHMERTASENWGQKSSVDVTHRGVVGLHLDAIRQLASEPLEGEYAYGEADTPAEKDTLEGSQDSDDGGYVCLGVAGAGDDDDNSDDYVDSEGHCGVDDGHDRRDVVDGDSRRGDDTSGTSVVTEHPLL